MQNVNKPPMHVRHCELERYSEDSYYKSNCPACEGILLVGRDQETFQLSATDRCVLCGQRYIYDDIELLRNGPIPPGTLFVYDEESYP